MSVICILRKDFPRHSSHYDEKKNFFIRHINFKYHQVICVIKKDFLKYCDEKKYLFSLTHQLINHHDYRLK